MNVIKKGLRFILELFGESCVMSRVGFQADLFVIGSAPDEI